jgi:hypothetical protein
VCRAYRPTKDQLLANFEKAVGKLGDFLLVSVVKQQRKQFEDIALYKGDTLLTQVPSLTSDCKLLLDNFRYAPMSKALAYTQPCAATPTSD